MQKYINSKYEPRSWQNEAFPKIKNLDKSIIVAITGSGKTLVQYALTNYHFSINKGQAINLIVTSGIPLTQQIAKEYLEHNTNAIVICFNSGSITPKTDEEFENDWLKSEGYIIKDLTDDERNELVEIYYNNKSYEEFTQNDIISTTDKNELKKLIKQANKDLKNVLIVSTYNSLHQLKNINFSSAIFDEAHCGAEKEMRIIIKSINSPHKFFFTGTPKGNKGSGGNSPSGMYVKDVFGEIEYEYKYKEAVNDNVIVQMAISEIVTSDRDVESKHEEGPKLSYVRKIIELDKKRIETYRIVINLDRKTSAQYVYENIKLNNHHNTYIVISDKVEKYSYKEQKPIPYDNKMDAVEAMKEDTEPFVVINIMMLNVGIDVPGFTSLGATSSSGSIRLLQSIGRVMRVDENDKNKKWKCGEVNKDMVKAFGVFYMYNGGSDAYDNKKTITSCVKFLFDNFGTMLLMYSESETTTVREKGEEGTKPELKTVTGLVEWSEITLQLFSEHYENEEINNLKSMSFDNLIINF